LKRYRVEPVFTKLGIDPQLRAERLSIEQFAELAAALED
jgi:16S rRNA A1518/A1519 N6-dimethyltransferase RsmA/KsgA/DIM1 with predicted DNA glycosylase/AP lyase activity